MALRPVRPTQKRGRVSVPRFRRVPDTRRLPEAISTRISRRDLWEEDYQEWLLGPGRGLGTRPEYAVWRWLVQHGHTPDVDFTYQGSLMGGRQELGGIVADFILVDRVPNLIIRVQGEYWHYGDPAVEAKDRIQKEQLVSMGFEVVDVKAADAMTRTDQAMEAALRGQQLF